MSDEEREPWHGTSSGYCHHACRCEECRTYRREYQRQFRAERPEARKADVMRTQAANRALARLRRRHADEYAVLYAEELGKRRALAKEGT